MSYQVIARKWRPQTFDDLVGQQHVTETLNNAIKNDRLAPANVSVLLDDNIVTLLRAPLAGYDRVPHGKSCQFSVFQQSARRRSQRHLSVFLPLITDNRFSGRNFG